MDKSPRVLDREATRFLRAHGITPSGRPKGSVSWIQWQFERRMIRTSARGKSTR